MYVELFPLDNKEHNSGSVDYIYRSNVGKTLYITEEMSDSISDDAISSRSTTLDYDCLIKFLSLG